MRYIKSRLYLKFYDGDGDGGNPPSPPPPPPASFTQEQVNAFLAKEKKGWEARNKATIDELNRLKNESGTSKERVAELETMIQSLESQYLSKEELAKKEMAKEAERQKKIFEDTVKEKETWQSQYNNLLVENAIRAASTKYDAFSTDQMLTQLGGKAKVVPVLADGKPTGKYQVIVTISGDDGKVLEVSADDAIKYMKEKPEIYGNLFKANVNGGVGGNNGGTTGPLDIKKVTSDAETYRKNRERLKNG